MYFVISFARKAYGCLSGPCFQKLYIGNWKSRWGMHSGAAWKSSQIPRGEEWLPWVSAVLVDYPWLPLSILMETLALLIRVSS